MKTTEHLGFYGYLRILKPDNLIEAMHNANKSNILFTAILELRRAGTNGGGNEQVFVVYLTPYPDRGQYTTSV